jgi:hypothetical protein
VWQPPTDRGPARDVSSKSLVQNSKSLILEIREFPKFWFRQLNGPTAIHLLLAAGWRFGRIVVARTESEDFAQPGDVHFSWTFLEIRKIRAGPHHFSPLHPGISLRIGPVLSRKNLPFWLFWKKVENIFHNTPQILRKRELFLLTYANFQRVVIENRKYLSFLPKIRFFKYFLRTWHFAYGFPVLVYLKTRFSFAFVKPLKVSGAKAN